MRVLLRLPATEPDWDAASDYVERSIPVERLQALAEWAVSGKESLREPLLTDEVVAQLRERLRGALEELCAAVLGIEPYGDRWSDAERRAFDGAEVLAGHVTHADNSITDIYRAIHDLDCGGVLEVLGCEREG